MGVSCPPAHLPKTFLIKKITAGALAAFYVVSIYLYIYISMSAFISFFLPVICTFSFLFVWLCLFTFKWNAKGTRGLRCKNIIS